MTYNFNPTQHSTKIKAGLLKAKQAGKKLGRPKGKKIKGEDEVIKLLGVSVVNDIELTHVSIGSDGLGVGGLCKKRKFTHLEIAKQAGVSKSTVQKIINKYKKT